ncbi:(d)CMP kinase [Paenibacillus thermoaerophilus]|uniref:Cytidylate kinase n=1 Tax=Paenibacillus thermoaerophilus TaxID=1215385 RepID=A0ABW2V2Q7_9BACL|nr:(d)CMP kinase [Paenibacillus thermoaerophilus]TMV18727.1 (d)CMP kinase [Paenibacillus thermoaerophilus]
MKPFNIAIDGPAGAGKSTVARRVAEALGFVYVDTGAMYRAVTWNCLERGCDPDEDENVAKLARQCDIRLRPGENGQEVWVNGRNVTEEIRSAEVTSNVSRIAQNREVRELLADMQRRMAAEGGVVMDGRDIGTTVLPDAPVKVFLTASPRARAERRFLELKDKRPSLTVEELEKEIAERDRMDSEREVSPLVQAPDAVRIDSTNLKLEEVIGKILELCRTKVAGEA